MQGTVLAIALPGKLVGQAGFHRGAHLEGIYCDTAQEPQELGNAQKRSSDTDNTGSKRNFNHVNGCMSAVTCIVLNPLGQAQCST